MKVRYWDQAIVRAVVARIMLSRGYKGCSAPDMSRRQSRVSGE